MSTIAIEFVADATDRNTEKPKRMPASRYVSVASVTSDHVPDALDHVTVDGKHYEVESKQWSVAQGAVRSVTVYLRPTKPLPKVEG